MRARKRTRLFILALAFMTSAGLLYPAEAKKPMGKSIFLSPRQDSHIAGGRVVIIGKFPKGGGMARLLLNGKPLDGIKKSGESFSVAIKPSAGRYTLEASKGALKERLEFTYGPKSGGHPVYTFHQPILDGGCSSCHGIPGKNLNQLKADTCYTCHDSWEGNPYVHGPVGAGECLFCHDPHGSIHLSLSRYEAKQQCTACHDQPSSTRHINRRQHSECGRCHDSHGGKDQNFLKSSVK